MTYGQLAGVLMFVVILVSALGTQGRVRSLTFPATHQKDQRHISGDAGAAPRKLAVFRDGQCRGGSTAALTFLMLNFWGFPADLRTAMVVFRRLACWLRPAKAEKTGGNHPGAVAAAAAVVLRLGWLPENV